jgi:hypothetical protein
VGRQGGGKSTDSLEYCDVPTLSGIRAAQEDRTDEPCLLEDLIQDRRHRRVQRVYRPERMLKGVEDGRRFTHSL